jgi:HEAT repeat protein
MPLVPAVETALRRALGDPSWSVRHAAAHALHAAGVRWAAADALLSLDRRPVVETPFRRRLLARTPFDIGDFAARCLPDAGAGDPAVVPLFLTALGGAGDDVRRKARDSLMSLAASGSADATFAIDLDNKDRSRRALEAARDARFELWKARQRRLDALVAEGAPALAERLANPRRNVAARALAAIERLGEAGSSTVPAIVALLGRTRSARLRRRAARVLGAIGPAAGGAVPALLSLLDDPNAPVRAVAARSLGRVGITVGGH